MYGPGPFAQRPTAHFHTSSFSCKTQPILPPSCTSQVPTLPAILPGSAPSCLLEVALNDSSWLYHCLKQATAEYRSVCTLQDPEWRRYRSTYRLATPNATRNPLGLDNLRTRCSVVLGSQPYPFTWIRPPAHISRSPPIPTMTWLACQSCHDRKQPWTHRLNPV